MIGELLTGGDLGLVEVVDNSEFAIIDSGDRCWGFIDGLISSLEARNLDEVENDCCFFDRKFDFRGDRVKETIDDFDGVNLNIVLEVNELKSLLVNCEI